MIHVSQSCLSTRIPLQLEKPLSGLAGWPPVQALSFLTVPQS